MKPSSRRGFTLLESAAVIGMVSLLVGVTMPAVQRARVDMRGAGSAANLAFIGQGAAMYATDHEGRIFTYTWGVPDGASFAIFELPDGTMRIANNDQAAAGWQNTEILMRRTGRIDGPTAFKSYATRLPHTRLRHLVLMDYLDLPFPAELFADPADANLLQWKADPENITAANNIPYSPGADFNGYDEPTGWSDVGTRQRWPFSSSYFSVSAAWMPDGLDGEALYIPVASTPHLHQQFGGRPSLAQGRSFAEVAFPSAKVHMFEEFDRRQAGSPYFGYDHARPMKLMFDGSINDRPSGEATPSWNPSQGKQEWRQRYVPLHTFPHPLGGLGETTPLSQRYRWTLGGLRGIDYAAPLMRR
ncbi:MAG: type II secretion system GspH family protein [Phycisphaerales bacterium]|nr:type II secretion system protein [Planctomycetota bacterium]MCH8508407.1 type II secretion system GspH family protein [Phycisphaerales bacterium]